MLLLEREEPSLADRSLETIAMVAGAEVRAIAQGAVDRFHDRRMIVSEQQCPVTAEVIDILVPVDIPSFNAVGNDFTTVLTTEFKHYLNLYLVLLVLVTFSFYNYYLFSNQIYLQILFGFVFFRYALPPARAT